MRFTLGKKVIRKSDGKVFTVKFLGAYAGRPGGRREPLFEGHPIKLEADDGEKLEYPQKDFIKITPLFAKVED